MTNQPRYQLRRPLKVTPLSDGTIYLESGVGVYHDFRLHKAGFDGMFVPVDVEEVTRQLETMLEILSETFFSAGLERARMTSSAEMVAQGEQLKESFQAMLAEIRTITQGETE